MNIFYAAILGAVQGLTEFLPISSSGHLVIAQHLVPGFSQPGVLFDVVLHAGTLGAVLFYFRKKILSMNHKYMLLIIIGTIPAVVIGLLFQDQVEAIFSNLKLVGVALLVTGAMNYLVDRLKTSKSLPSGVDAFVIGLGQAFAIVPGISRSGTTIFAATARGLKREDAAEFSFLLSIPAILGAIALQILKYHNGAINIPSYATGFTTAFIFGVISIKVLLNLLRSKKLIYFAIYCLILGSLVLII